MDRRSFLGTSGVATLAGLAGCAGFLGDGDRSSTTTDTTAAAEFADPTIEPPADPTVGEEVAVTVAVTNEGEAPGEFAATLELTGPRELSKSVTVEAVPPGETGSTTVEFGVDYAGTYTARVPDTDASTEFVVQPREADLGAAATLGEGFQVAVEDARVEPALIAEGRGPLHLHGAASRLGGIPHVVPATEPADAPADHPVAALPDDSEVVLLVVEATVTNEGDQPRAFDPAALSVRTAVGPEPRFYADMGREVHEGITVADAAATLGTPPLAGADLAPEEDRRGWLLAPVARETASEGAVEVGIQRASPDAAGDDGGPPETVWEVVPEGGTPLPQFEVKDLSLPDRVPNLTTAEFSLTVENVGDASGTYRDVIEISGIMPEFDPVGWMSGDLAAGETAEVRGEFLMPWGANQGFRLQVGNPEVIRDLEEYEEVDRGAHAECIGDWLELGFDGTASFPNGTVVRVQNPVYAETYEYSDAYSIANRVLLVNVEAYLPEWAVGEGLGDELLPALEDFGYDIHPDWEPEDPLRILLPKFQTYARRSGDAIDEPIEAPLYPVTPPEEPDDGVVEGWIELRNPDDDHIDEYPREQRELQVEVPVKRRGNYAKVAGVKWAGKFG